MTKRLQPIDLTVNKSFKDRMRACWENWMVEDYHEYTKSGNLKRASYITVCKWVVDSWSKVPPQIIIDEFKQALDQDYNDEEITIP